MEIKVCKTSEWSSSDWESYALGFNEVFEKNFPVDLFKRKYTNVIGGESYHALLLNDENKVVGGCTVIPCLYNRNGEEFINGLALDVFIRQDYRTDPLMLRRMYKKLLKKLEENNIVAVMAVPNATAYPYWKNVVKWQDVGDINYWVLPVKIGNIVKRFKFLNIFSQVYAYIVLLISYIFSFLNTKSKSYEYEISSNDEFYKKRFDSSYSIYSKGNSSYVYRIFDEEGVKTAYLLEAKNEGKNSFRIMIKAVRRILQDNVDIILFVGKMGFFQTLFVKTPKSFEPKRLPLTCDLISKDSKYNDMLNINNWDFGLKNYDVR